MSGFAPTAQDRGYPLLIWPTGADKDHYRKAMRREYPKATDEQIEELARAGAMIDAGSKRFRAIAPVDQEEAEELAFTRAIPHVVHGMAIIDRNAA